MLMGNFDHMVRNLERIRVRQFLSRTSQFFEQYQKMSFLATFIDLIVPRGSKYTQ